jgi:hypothetical protein
MLETMPTFDDVDINIIPTPVKGTDLPGVDTELIQRQAELGAEHLVPVDYATTHGTCGDERERIGLLNGSHNIQPRPSVFAGPDVFGLAVAELTGSLPDVDSTARDRLARIKKLLNEGGVMSGGHVECAANAKFIKWIGVIASRSEDVRGYASLNLGQDYDPTAMEEVEAFARRTVEGGVYDDWTEDVLKEVLGDEAGEAIEVLAPVEHEGLMLERNEEPDSTIDQTPVFENSVVGRGSFIFDDAYAKRIEDIVTSGPEAARKVVLARHAREAIIAAVASAVPNPTIYQAKIG